MLYDNEYEAAFWMCFDTNKQYLGSGDVLKDVNSHSTIETKKVICVCLFSIHWN